MLDVSEWVWLRSFNCCFVISGHVWIWLCFASCCFALVGLIVLPCLLGFVVFVLFVTYGLFTGLFWRLVLSVIFGVVLYCCFGFGIRQVCCVIYSWLCLFAGFGVNVLCVTCVLWLGFVVDTFVLVYHMKLGFGFLFDVCGR